VKDPAWHAAYIRLHRQAALKRLETPHVYNIGRDDLYEIDERALAFFARCDGSTKGAELAADDQFVEFCLAEELLELLPLPDPMAVAVAVAPVPSLRYLELQLTRRCNLRCRHCYLGPARPADLPLEDALRIAEQFSSHGGLRMLISGGEPLLYPHLAAFLAAIATLPVRRILITNGTLITEENMGTLGVNEVQFSLDGWERGHEMIRGPGSFALTMRGIEAVRRAGIPISIATMIHRGNLDEFERLRGFLEEIGAIEWGVDALVLSGSLQNNRDVCVSYEDTVPLMAYAYGGGSHGASDGFACGRHLMTVTPAGTAIKCGFYEDAPLGDASRDLIACWLNLRHIQVEELECSGCEDIEECHGGCRFRAAHPLAPDPVMCALYGRDPMKGTT
jgi:radical SAM protein with 4Fe4S-binding SPASM domain